MSCTLKTHKILENCMVQNLSQTISSPRVQPTPSNNDRKRNFHYQSEPIKQTWKVRNTLTDNVLKVPHTFQPPQGCIGEKKIIID